MARDVLANRAVRMLGQFPQSLPVCAWMFADQAQKVIIRFRRLLDQLFQHLGFRISAQNQTDLFVPGGVDVIQFTRAGMNQFFERAAFLLRAGDGKIGALERIENTQKMLAFAEDDLRSACHFSLLFFLVLHQIRTSHGFFAPAAPWSSVSGSASRQFSREGCAVWL